MSDSLHPIDARIGFHLDHGRTMAHVVTDNVEVLLERRDHEWVPVKARETTFGRPVAAAITVGSEDLERHLAKWIKQRGELQELA